MRSISALPLLAMTTCLYLGSGGLSAAQASIVETLSETATSEKLTRLADARSYRHCHNIHTRVYCHKSDRLPVNWPPHSDTPSQQRIETQSQVPPFLRQKRVMK